MAARDGYKAQVELLIRCLPAVAGAPEFALKGGTAINLFLRDMPRLSVDIDLAYLPVSDRDTALTDIRAQLTAIAEAQPATNAAASATRRVICSPPPVCGITRVRSWNAWPRIRRLPTAL
jgi:hypothetical protein